MDAKGIHILRSAIDLMKNHNASGFISEIRNFFAIQQCKCYLSTLEKSEFKSLTEFLSEYTDLSDTDRNYCQGIISYLLQDHQLAYQSLKEVIKTTNADPLPLELRANLPKEINKDYYSDIIFATLIEPTAARYYRLARSAESAGQKKRAAAYYANCLSLDADFAHAYYYYARLLYGQGRLVDARNNFAIGFQLDKTAENMHGLWLCLFDNKEFNEALAVALKGIEIFPNYSKFFSFAGQTHEQLGNKKPAILAYRAYLSKIKDDDSRIYNQNNSLEIEYRSELLKVAREHGASNEISKALLVYDEILQLFPNRYFDSEKDYLTYFSGIAIRNGRPINVSEDSNLYKDYLRLLNSGLQKKDYQSDQHLTDDELNVAKLTVYYPSWKIGFGKYDGQTIDEVLKTDAQYLIWAINNLLHFAVCNSLFLREELRAIPGYLEALETNLTKVLFTKELPEDEKEYESNSWDDDYDTYDKYEGSYAQNIEGYSDQDIDDLFDGDPTAYWNID